MRSIRPFVLSIVAVLFAVATVLVSTEAFARTWKTDKSSIEGEFDSLQDDGAKVRIKRSDGKFVRVDLYKLSEEDQQYIKQITSESDDFEEEPEENDFEEEKESTPSIIPPVPEEEDSVDNLINTINLLEKKGEYQIVRQKLLMALQENFSEKLVELWIQLDTNLCPNSNNYKRTLSIFIPEEITWKERYEQVMSLGEHQVNPPIAPTYSHSEKYAELYKNRFDKNVAKNFGTIDINTISKTLKIYDVLKQSTEDLLSYLSKEMTHTNDINMSNTLTNYSSKVKAFKKNLKIHRTIFLSYNVVSPYLADADRWLYLANEQKDLFLRPQKESLEKAVKMLSLSCHGQHLYECNEDVRKQFFEVQKKLKSMVSSTEYEELKVLTTLQDSSDPSKKRGADAWWE